MGGPSEYLLDLAIKNVAVLYWDARSGSTRDWTEHGLDGVDAVAGTVPRVLRANGWEFRTIPAGPPGNNQIQVLKAPDNALLKLAKGTIMVLGPFQREAAPGGDSLVSMDDGAAASYRLALNLLGANSITLADNIGGLALWTDDYRGAKTVAVTFGPGVPSQAYLDGASLGGGAAVAPTYPAPAKTFRLGNGFPMTSPSQNPLGAVVMCNDILTAAEIQKLHQSVVGMQWATLPYQQWRGISDARLDWSLSASEATTLGPGDQVPFTVWGAGIGRVVMDTIQGDVVKCYENRDPNLLELPYGPSGLSRDNDPVRLASGIWEWWWKYTDPTMSFTHILCADVLLPDRWELVDDGVDLRFVSSTLGTIAIFPTTLGAGWTSFRVERDPTPTWTWRIYVNNILVGTYSPGAVVTQSQLGSMLIPAGGRLAIGSRDGRFNWRKRD